MSRYTGLLRDSIGTQQTFCDSQGQIECSLVTPDLITHACRLTSRMNTKVHLDLSDLSCACDFNPNTGRGPHTVIKKLWIGIADYKSFQAAQMQASRITTSEETTYVQSPDELDVVCDILGMSKESFLDEVEQFSKESRAAVTARQGKHIQTCSDYQGQTKGFSKKQLEMCIRSKFQPRWAGKHKGWART